MNRLLEVCLVALAVTTTITPPIAAQSPAMQKGIRVELPVASNAIPMPDADREDSLVVTVTGDGRVYLGINPISPAALAENVRDSLSSGSKKKLYIKADARTPYANVANVLNALRTAGVEAPNLLTASQDSPEPGTLVPPRGLEVLVGESRTFGAGTPIVQVLDSGQRRPTLQVNNDLISWTSLQSMLQQLLQNRSKKVVLVNAAGTLPFVQLVDVIDVCRSAGAKVVLVTR